MGLIHIDGFEGSGGVPWSGTEAGEVGSQYRRSGLQGIRISNWVGPTKDLLLSGVGDQLTFGFAYRALSFDGFWTDDIVTIVDSQNRLGFSLYATSALRTLGIWVRNYDNPPTNESKTYSRHTWVRHGVWYYIECVFTGAGITLYINGKEECTSPPIVYPEWDGIKKFRWGPGGSDMHFDDFYISSDNAAPTYGRYGDATMRLLRPTQYTDTAQWVPSSGTNYACVNEAEQDGDGSYVETATSGARDLYELSDLDDSPDTIIGVQVVYVAKKQGSGQQRVRPVVRLGGSALTAEAAELATSYDVPLGGVFLSRPGGGSWTSADIANLQAGMETL